MSRVLVVSPDVTGSHMAGVGIRYWNVAAALARQGVEVTLATLGEEQLAAEGFEIAGYSEASYQSLAPHVQGKDVLLVSGYLLHKFPALRELRVPMVVDLWAPFILENLEVFADGSLASRMMVHRHTVAVVNEQLKAGDFFVCASERQRDFWLGMLATNNRLNPYTYADDPTFRRLLAIVPFGLPLERPRHTQSVLKGVHPGIKRKDKVVLWSGGIWDWYDPQTLILGVHRLLDTRQDVKLVFLGAHHPNPAVPDSRKLVESIALSKQLGLYDRHVFFSEWVPYEEMQNYLLESDVGAVLHHDHIETRFSFRARILGYLWGQLPILITEGSPSSEIVRSEDLGRVVGYEDVEATAQALSEMLALPDLRTHYLPNFERIRARFMWDRVVQPIVGFCRAPRLAPDKNARVTPEAVTPYWALPARAWRILRERGVSGMAHEIRSYARWWRARRTR